MAVINLREAVKLRPTTDTTAPEHAFDIVLKSPPRAYTLVPFPATRDERDAWLSLWATLVPRAAVEGTGAGAAMYGMGMLLQALDEPPDDEPPGYDSDARGSAAVAAPLSLEAMGASHSCRSRPRVDLGHGRAGEYAREDARGRVENEGIGILTKRDLMRGRQQRRGEWLAPQLGPQTEDGHSKLNWDAFPLGVPEAAIANYEVFHQLKRGSATLEQVASSSSGVEGWAAAQRTAREETEAAGWVVLEEEADVSPPPEAAGLRAPPPMPGDAEEAKEIQRALLASVGVSCCQPKDSCEESSHVAFEVCL